MLLPAGCWLQAAESPKKPLTIGQGKLTSCFAGWQAVRRMPPNVRTMCLLGSAADGRPRERSGQKDQCLGFKSCPQTPIKRFEAKAKAIGKLREAAATAMTSCGCHLDGDCADALVDATVREVTRAAPHPHSDFCCRNCAKAAAQDIPRIVGALLRTMEQQEAVVAAGAEAMQASADITGATREPKARAATRIRSAVSPTLSDVLSALWPLSVHTNRLQHGILQFLQPRDLRNLGSACKEGWVLWEAVTFHETKLSKALARHARDVGALPAAVHRAAACAGC